MPLGCIDPNNNKFHKGRNSVLYKNMTPKNLPMTFHLLPNIIRHKGITFVTFTTSYLQFFRLLTFVNTEYVAFMRSAII